MKYVQNNFIPVYYKTCSVCRLIRLLSETRNSAHALNHIHKMYLPKYFAHAFSFPPRFTRHLNLFSITLIHLFLVRLFLYPIIPSSSFRYILLTIHQVDKLVSSLLNAPLPSEKLEQDDLCLSLKSSIKKAREKLLIRRVKCSYCSQERYYIDKGSKSTKSRFSFVLL